MALKKERIQKEGSLVDERLRHIAFIMDGNGRWAQKRGMPRSYGHSVGAETFRRVAEYCRKIGIRYMTVYAFSTENWKRPHEEVQTIMDILTDYIDKCANNAEKENIHVRFIGNLSVFSQDLQDKMERIDRETVHHPFCLNIAFNYGGREELVHACTALIREGNANVTEADISANLYTANCPDPDLIVRTGGDMRISNFLLWQSAYAEYHFTDVLWPDFSERDVDAAVAAFYSRRRRFGGV
ncbi:MAG: di-trans,poly-cis-decaprenylcistransferase [Ruminococcaceae bacterium]|nr:di-trans,poly-cis-decaprenylcistransferase [Oscillospiraceae bacterium]